MEDPGFMEDLVEGVSEIEIESESESESEFERDESVRDVYESESES